MKHLLAFVLLCILSVTSRAESGIELEHPDVDIFDQLSIIRGAGYFADYCLGCHGLKQIRYSRIGKDLRVNEPKLRELMLFGDARIHDPVKTAMTSKAAEVAFGVIPPDLSLIVRSRGADWIYSYLKGFYDDPKRPFGVNNIVAPNVAMPNPLWALQGPQKAVMGRVDGKLEIVGVESAGHGTLTRGEFDKAVNDIVTFLAYVAEPSALQRIPLGKFVILFLAVLTYLFYLLKKDYWKEID